MLNSMWKLAFLATGLIFLNQLSYAQTNTPPALSNLERNVISLPTTGIVNITETITIDDPDSKMMSSAEIKFVDGTYDAYYDRLFLQKTVGAITAKWDASGGALALSGVETKANYEQAIKNVVYSFTDYFAPSQVNKIAITVSDGNNFSEAVIRYIAVKNPSYTPAWLQDFEKNVNEDQDMAFSASDFQNNYQPDAARFTGINIRSLPQHGSLIYQENAITEDDILKNNGSLRIEASDINQLVYRPDTNYAGNDAFLWNSHDGKGMATSDALVNIVVNEVNDSSVITAPAEISDIPEDSEFALEDISVSDIDDETVSVSLAVTNGTLSLPENLHETVNFSQGDGQEDKTLVFNGTLDNVNTALAALTYLSDPDYAGTDQLKIQVTDRLQGGTSATTSATVDLTIIQTNDAPQISGVPDEPLTYTEDDAPVAIAPDITIRDDENNNIIEATIGISEGFVAKEDSLHFSPKKGISVTIEGNQLILQGEASVSDYQQLLRSVAYKNMSQSPSSQDRVVAFQLTDDEEAVSEAVTRMIKVVSVDDPPVLSNIETQTLNFVQFGGAVNISGNIRVNDVDSENLNRAVISLAEDTHVAGQDVLLFNNTDKITSQWDKNKGVLTLQGTASLAEYSSALRKVQYQNTSETPNTTPRTLNIQVFNGKVGSNMLSRDIAIIANERPTISSFSKATDEDVPLAITYNDFLKEGKYQDPDNFPSENGFSRIAILALPTQGILVVNNDTLTQAMVDNSNAGYEIPKDSLAGLSYIPSENYSGSDSITWNAFDGAQYASQHKQVNITIEPVDDAPVVTDVALSMNEDDTLNFELANFTDAYTDAEEQALRKIIIRTTPSQGSLVLNGMSIPANTEISTVNIGQLLYVPAKNYNGNDSFTWAASDGAQTSTETADVSISIVPVNDAPVIQNFTKAVADGEDIHFSSNDFANNYIDVENDPLAYITIEATTTGGQLLLDGVPVSAGIRINTDMISKLMYRHDPTMGVKDAFTWKASDGSAVSAETATAFIIVGIGVTDFELTLNEDKKLSFTPENFLNNYGNPDADLQAVRIESLPLNGTLNIGDFPVTKNQVINLSNLHQLTYEPDTNYYGLDSLIWNATDGSQFSEESAYIRLTINAVNDLPQITAIEDVTLVTGASTPALSFTISDVETEASALEVSVISDNQDVVPNEQLILSGSGDSRTLIVNTLENTEGTANIILTVSDGQRQTQTSFSIRVVPYFITLEAGEDIEICSNAPLTISTDEIVGGVAPYVYNWSCNQEECQIQDQFDNSVTISPATSTSYFVQVTDANGIISNLDTIHVRLVDCSSIELDIPSGFTPNGDGIHDTWEIGKINYVENAVVQVFNRSGQKVYYAEAYDTPWDGTYNGRPLPVGTYYYVVSVDHGSRIFKGSITILR